MARKEYLERIYDESIEFQRTGLYDLMCLKKEGLGCYGNQGVQTIGSEDS